MRKILAFIAVLLVVLLFFRNVREGIANKYDTVGEKYELVKALNGLKDKDISDLNTSDILSTAFKGTSTSVITTFLESIPTSKIGNLKDSNNLTADVKEALSKIIDNNSGNSEPTKVTSNTQMSVVETKLKTKKDSQYDN